MFSLVKYDKVIVLDRELFEREALVAVRRHPQGKYLD
jgi:hypothetical protein